MRRLSPTLAAVALVLLAFAIRIADLDRFVTIDESRWIQRGSDFLALVLQRDFEDTFIIGHPGVTTMWMAALGMGWEQAERMSFRAGRVDVTRRDGYFEALLSARRAFVLASSLVIGVVALLLWRLFGPGPALLSGLLLSADPFLAAHSQVVHLDANLAGFMAIATLSAVVFWQAQGGPGYLMLCGLATGLALITKAPSIYLLGIVPLLAVGSRIVTARSAWWRVVPRAVVELALWGAIAACVALAIWPALRVDPMGTLRQMAQFTARVGGGEHDNYFLGQPTDDPGWLYYPVALAYRIGIGTLIGLVLLGIYARAQRLWRAPVLTLAVFGIGFWLMMNLGPKKFDRYLLPMFPALAVLAGLGWWALLRAVSPKVTWRPAVLIATVALVTQLGPALAVRPYYLAYYNPLLGGGPVAARALLVGWGEGMDQVAAYLNRQPVVLGAPTVASSYHRVIQAHLVGSALPLERVGFADYVVPYVNTLQRGLSSDVLAPIVAGQQAEYSVWFNGVEYARVYRGPHHPTVLSVSHEWPGLTLVEAVVAPGGLRLEAGDELQLLLRWRQADMDAVLLSEVRVVDSRGETVVRDSRTLGEDGAGGARGGTPDQTAELHTLAIPRRLPPGNYSLQLSVRERSDLALISSTGLTDLVLGTVEVTAPTPGPS